MQERFHTADDFLIAGDLRFKRAQTGRAHGQKFVVALLKESVLQLPLLNASKRLHNVPRACSVGIGMPWEG